MPHIIILSVRLCVCGLRQINLIKYTSLPHKKPKTHDQGFITNMYTLGKKTEGEGGVTKILRAHLFIYWSEHVFARGPLAVL